MAGKETNAGLVVINSGRVARHGVDERGFTVIEMIAALTVLAIGILGLAPVFVAAARSASSGMHRARALALATRDIEAYRSVPYCSLGFSTGTPPTVVVTNPAAGIPPANSSETVDGIRYGFSRQIVWVSATNLQTGATNANAYKRVTVEVTWKAANRTNSARQSSIIYPGGIGSYTDSGCGESGAAGLQAPPSAVTDLAATTDGVDPDTSIVLNWSNPPTVNFDKYRIVYSFDNFATSFPFSDVSLTARPTRVTGLTPGVTYQFQVLSARPSTGEYTPSNRASAPTVATASPTCTIGTVSLSPAGVKQAATGSTLQGNIGVGVNASGSCSGLQLSYVADEGSANATVLALTESAPGPWTATINGTTTNWSVGPHTIAVTDASGTVLNSATKLTVCINSAASCP